LKIEDASQSLAVVARLPAHTAVGAKGSEAPAPPPADFFQDPRFSALGHRAVLAREDADALVGQQGLVGGAAAYHRWRVCCAVPEGPADLPVDQVLPLHANLDLLNFVSFTKGCYTGQELTTRTKHRGAVRRRFFSAVAAADGDPAGLVERLGLAASDALPLGAVLEDAAAVLPGLQVIGAAPEVDEEARAVQVRKPDSEKWHAAGVLHSAANNVGLCMLRCEGAFNSAESFKEQSALPAGALLQTAAGLPLVVRAPPYAFIETEEGVRAAGGVAGGG